MSKLSPQLKELIDASFARPGTVAAPKNIRSVYQRVAQEAGSKDVGLPCWLTMLTAATMTMNSPDSMVELHRVATPSRENRQEALNAAEMMREVGLKCISFNGIPRTINCLGAFRASLPSDIVNGLSTTPTRAPNVHNIKQIHDRGQALWASIYTPLDEKLVGKLAQSHPDLPVHIIDSHYGPLLADPPREAPDRTGTRVGRVLTSILAIACLRAQTGVGPQVTSHLFGLRKACEEGRSLSSKSDGEEDVKGGQWLASDEGNLWILRSVDSIVEAIGAGAGTTFAPGIRAKL
ncbi:MAG: hypothetical protein M1837_000120 [Sclerophora amabilis]|nr:MAG: hypothetical protein M1837_000120 [Sclerophora amabilis]